MNILYLTTHITTGDFNFLVEKSIDAPNPAGQNFHGKLLKALALYNKVFVYSVVPSNEERLANVRHREEDGISFTYFHPKRHAIIPNAITLSKAIEDQVRSDYKKMKGEETVVVFDSLNIALARAAKAISSSLKLPRVAVCTDDPFNISLVGMTYIHQVLSSSANCDGYYCLTKDLDFLFNKFKKPSLIRLGIVEEVEKKEPLLSRPYIYYGGALFVKDGTEALLHSYLKAKPDFDLVIAGHGPYCTKLKDPALKEKGVIFLGQISKEDNYAYEQHASLAINPRIYRYDLDKVSVPSKNLEYLQCAPVIASTLSTPLKEEFDDSINWIASSQGIVEPGLDELFAKIGKGTSLEGLKKNTASARVLSKYGIESIGRDFTDFLSTLIRR